MIRAFAGAAEACSDPASLIITSMWYSRRQQPLKIGIWYTAQGFGIATGGLLGYGIGNIRGSLVSWKYEFLIIGALCCVWGVAVFIWLPDSPVTARMLTPKERRIAVERLREDQTGVENKNFKWYQFKETVLDPKTWLLYLMAVSIVRQRRPGFANLLLGRKCNPKWGYVQSTQHRRLLDWNAER